MHNINNWLNYTFIIWVISLSVVCDSFNRSVCRMMNGGGQCVKLRECDVALKLFKSTNFGTEYEEFKNTLRTIACGFEGKEPKVCCPNNDKLDVPFGCSQRAQDLKPVIQSRTSAQTVYDIPQNETLHPCSVFEATAKQIEKKTSAQKPIVNEPQELRIILTKKETAMISRSIQDLPIDKLRLLPDLKTCGKVESESRIVGGNVANIDEFPWLAAIIYKRKGKHVMGCGATLINDRYVITATHCVNTPYPIHVVRLGEFDTETDPDCQTDDHGPDNKTCNTGIVDYSVITITRIEDNTNRSFPEHDIALLRLNGTVDRFTDFIRPICLPTLPVVANQDYSPENHYIVAGWGRTEFSRMSTVVRRVGIKYAEVDLCMIHYKEIITESNKHLYICAGGREGEDSCTGDSGGPLHKIHIHNYNTNYQLMGITSYGSVVCGKEGVPSVYTRIVPYLHWILNNIEP